MYSMVEMATGMTRPAAKIASAVLERVMAGGAVVGRSDVGCEDLEEMIERMEYLYVLTEQTIDQYERAR